MSSNTSGAVRAKLGSDFGASKANFFLNLFIYLFLAALALGCCVRAFSSCNELGRLFIAVHGPTTVPPGKPLRQNFLTIRDVQ